MYETWNETKARLKKQGITLCFNEPKPPIPRYESRVELPVKRFNIHKRSLPPGIDTRVVFNITREEADWWLEKRLKARCYQNDADESKTVIFYEILPVNAAPKERNIFYNPRPISL